MWWVCEKKLKLSDVSQKKKQKKETVPSRINKKVINVGKKERNQDMSEPLFNL